MFLLSFLRIISHIAFITQEKTLSHDLSASPKPFRRPRRGLLLLCLLLAGAGGSVTMAHADEPVSLYAAGSLKAALGDVARRYAERYETEVATTFGPSGLLRGRIEQGEAAQVFASANMKHPETLASARDIGPVVRFARNRLCALASPSLAIDTDGMLDVLLDPQVRVGTSTPKADPSGDYAWQLFDKAGGLRQGADVILKEKALQLTGGPDSAPPPEGRNPYAWVMSEGKADVFLTYCTNAVLASREETSLQVVAIPPALGVGADYGLLVLDEDQRDAWHLAWFILSPAGQEILAGYGFDAAGALD